MMAAPNILPWVIKALPGLDAAEEADQLDAFRGINRMMTGRLSWSAIAGMIQVRRAPHLEPSAPVDAATVGPLLEDELDHVPLADQLWLGDLQRRLRRGDQPTDADTKRVRAIRRAIAGAAA